MCTLSDWKDFRIPFDHCQQLNRPLHRSPGAPSVCAPSVSPAASNSCVQSVAAFFGHLALGKLVIGRDGYGRSGESVRCDRVVTSKPIPDWSKCTYWSSLIATLCWNMNPSRIFLTFIRMFCNVWTKDIWKGKGGHRSFRWYWVLLWPCYNP